jgi:hypothetical protein
VKDIMEEDKYIAGSRCSRKPQKHLGAQQYWVSEFDETGDETGHIVTRVGQAEHR